MKYQWNSIPNETAVKTGQWNACETSMPFGYELPMKYLLKGCEYFIETVMKMASYN